MPELVIGVSNVISPLCSSLIRVEPFTECSFRCSYCYARWYRSDRAVIRDRAVAIKAFKGLARRVRRLGLKPVPARLATLTDPLQPHEELYLATLRILRIANRFEYPLILNTKSTMVSKDPWRRELAKLGEQGLLVIQVSISTLNREISRKLEPFAPPPLARLEAASKLCEECGAPLVVRISPFIPGVSTMPSVDEFVAKLRELGVKQVIVEGIRIESERKKFVEEVVGRELDWEPYSLREVEGLRPLQRVSLKSRLREYEELASKLRREGIGFSTCKEGLFHLHTVENCCGMHMIEDCSWRPTLWEIYKVLKSFGPMTIDEAIDRAKKIFSDRLWSEELAKYPRFISKPLKYHERKMLRVLRKPEVLERVCPSISFEGDKLVARW